MKFSYLKPFGVQIDISGAESLSAEALNVVKGALLSERLVLLRGLSAMNRETFLEFALFFSRKSENIEEQLLHWSFGPVMELKVDPSSENYLFSREEVPFHWDGAFHREPSFLAFNCIVAPVEGAGGETLYCDMDKVLASFDTYEIRRLEEMKMTYTTQKVAHYGGEFTVEPLFRHPRTGRQSLRFAEAVDTKLNPVALKIEGAAEEDIRHFQNVMKQKLYHPDYCYRHTWNDGDLLLVDNLSVMHGRTAFMTDTPRHIRRIQIL